MRPLALALLLACAPPRPPVPDALPEVDRLEQRVTVHGTAWSPGWRAAITTW